MPSARLRTGVPFLLAIACGCSGTPSDQPDLVPVEGTVTLDGSPLVGATVVFDPVDGPRPSRGFTDSDGNYRLTYVRSTRGAVLGQHVVSISTRVLIESEDADPDVERLPEYTKERVPKRYAKEKPTVDVESGRTKYDFALVSGSSG